MKIKEQKLEEIAYELYKIDWKSRISIERKLEAHRNYELELLENYDDDYTFDDWEFDNGYDEECYVCFDEFIDYEYEDEEYMKYLLSHNSVFWKAYLHYQESEEVYETE